MSVPVLLNLPEGLYEQATEIANEENRQVEEVLLESIAKSLTSQPAEAEDEMDEQGRIYEQMHPELVKHYLGQNVAIMRGQLIDHDPDIYQLVERVRVKYPSATVFFEEVQPQLPEVFLFRSPRLLNDEQ